jgi:hypothetical protein
MFLLESKAVMVVLSRVKNPASALLFMRWGVNSFFTRLKPLNPLIFIGCFGVFLEKLKGNHVFLNSIGRI